MSEPYDPYLEQAATVVGQCRREYELNRGHYESFWSGPIIAAALRAAAAEATRAERERCLAHLRQVVGKAVAGGWPVMTTAEILAVLDRLDAALDFLERGD